MLKIENLEVSVDGKKILKGINFSARRGEIHAIMGPNGSGKSSLAFTIMGNPKYKIENGSILFDGKDITHLKPDERAKAGIFLAFQYPHEIPGVPLGKFLWTIAGGGRNFADFSKEFKEKMSLLKIPDEFSKREINKGFSGGEKKRTEILQMLMLKPTLAILDEIDSGLDVDSLKIVSQAVLEFTQSKDKIVLIITHYPRILNYIKPDRVHVIFDGKIVLSGDYSLATEIEEKGYEKILKEIGFHIQKKDITAKDVL
ncbi:putative ABC transporter ATP-binding protein [bacterium HR19]|nr:putative ABC transporter ATP-binding protein [bacterium HR19]